MKGCSEARKFKLLWGRRYCKFKGGRVLIKGGRCLDPKCNMSRFVSAIAIKKKAETPQVPFKSKFFDGFQSFGSFVKEQSKRGVDYKSVEGKQKKIDRSSGVSAEELFYEFDKHVKEARQEEDNYLGYE